MEEPGSVVDVLSCCIHILRILAFVHQRPRTGGVVLGIPLCDLDGLD